MQVALESEESDYEKADFKTISIIKYLFKKTVHCYTKEYF